MSTDCESGLRGLFVPGGIFDVLSAGAAQDSNSDGRWRGDIVQLGACQSTGTTLPDLQRHLHRWYRPVDTK